MLSRLDLELSEIQTLQHSRKDPSNGLFEHERKKQGKQLGFDTTTCTEFQVRILRIDTGSSNRVPRVLFLHLL